MTSIMVSYSRKDSVAARKLIDAFEKMGMEVWVDWEDIPPAVGWLDQVLKGIEESDAFIFLISPDSIASEVCMAEVAHAAKNSKRIIPIVVRDVLAKDVVQTIRDINWIFGREQDDFEQCLAKIKIAIELDIEWVGEHKRLQIRALEWDRKKDISLLLRGRDLRTAYTLVRTAEKKNPTPTELQHIYIQHSRRNQRLLYIAWISTTIALLIMIALSLTAIDQARLAHENEARARQQEQQAKQNEVYAKQSEKRARAAEADARTSENLAKAQRSAAKAQIYQRPGELFTSTLLAIDSLQRSPSFEAEEILRKNISLLPIPVKQMAQGARINALRFSPDGDTFITGSADNTACEWTVKDGKMVFCATSSGSVNDAAFSPDGQIVVTGDELGHVLILDAKDGTLQNEIVMLPDPKSPILILGPNDTSPQTAPTDAVPVWDVNISPDGSLLAIARNDGNVIFIDLRTRKYDFGFYATGSLRVSAFSPNGRLFAAGSTNGSVTLWNLSTNKTVQAPPHHGQVLSIEFSPDSSRLVTGGTDSLALVAQTGTGAELFHIVNEDWVEDIAFSPDSSWFVTVSEDQRVRVWDTNTGKERLRMLQDSFVTAVQVSSNGQWIATTGADQTIRLWNASTGAEIFQIPLKASGSVLAFSKDGNYLVSGDEGGGVNIWDISTMISPTNYVQFSGLTGDVQFSPSGEWLAASDEGRVWLLNKGQFTTLTGSLTDGANLKLNANVQKLRFSPDSNWLAISTSGGELILYNMQSGEQKTVLHSDPAPNFVFSSDSSQIITASADGKVQAWDVASGKSVNTLLGAGSGVAALDITSNDLLAVGFIDKLFVWDLSSGELNSDVTSTGDHTFVALNAYGSLLAASNSSGQINIWQRKDGSFALLKSINSGNVFSMSFNPRGDQLLVGEKDVLYFFDPQTGGEIARIPHKDAVRGISFSADGATLATASFKVVQFWDVTKIPFIHQEQLVATACTRLIQNFDQAQWTAFFGENDPFRILCENLQH